MTEDSAGLNPEVAAYYAEGREQARLGSTSRLEFLRTQELLGRFLPHAPATVLDVGGGPGGHALPLASSGYAVHLIDPVALHIEQARAASARQPEAPLASAELGDARRLSWADASVDAALLLGPLYHLTERSERVGALREARRVVRPGGVVLAVAISRFASMYDGLIGGFLDEPKFEAIVERDLRDGQHRNPTRHRHWFTTAYFHHPDELRQEAVDVDLVVDALIAVEGPGSLVPDASRWLDEPVRRERLLRLLRQVETEPSILGSSAHMLLVARR